MFTKRVLHVKYGHVNWATWARSNESLDNVEKHGCVIKVH